MRGMRGGLVMATMCLAAVIRPEVALAADPEWHLGASFGSSTSDYNQRFINQDYVNQVSSAGGSLEVDKSSIRRSAHAWWVDVGWMGAGDLGVDAFYLDLGTIRPHSSGTIVGTNVPGAFTVDSSVRSHGPALAVTGITPINERFEIDARIGIYHGQTSLNSTVSDTAGTASTPTSARSNSLLAGVGGSFSIDEHWSIRVDYIYIQKAGDKASVGSYNVGVATAGVSVAF